MRSILQCFLPLDLYEKHIAVFFTSRFAWGAYCNRKNTIIQGLRRFARRHTFRNGVIVWHTLRNKCVTHVDCANQWDGGTFVTFFVTYTVS